MHPGLISDKNPVVIHEGKFYAEQHGRAVCLGASLEEALAARQDLAAQIRLAAAASAPTKKKTEV